MFTIIDGSIAGSAVDLTKSSLLSIANAHYATVDNMNVMSCSLLVSPALLLDTIVTSTVSNGIL